MDVRFPTLILFLVMSMLLFSCQSKKPEIVPTAIIGKDTMVQMLTELHLIEASLAIKMTEKRKINALRNELKEKLYAKYGMKKERFYDSYNYYKERPQIIDSLYINVLTELSKKQAQLLN